MSVYAVWKDLWERGISISIEFSGFDGGNDKCEACGKKRKFHRRGDDHKFAEVEK